MLKQILIITLFFLLSCDNRPICHISGSVPNNRYEGKWMYLVPFENASFENVDSCLIKNGKFSFDIKDEKVAILRMSYLIRDSLQELLVVTEPGNIKVTIDTISFSCGTPQNDFLQCWKECKRSADMAGRMIYEAISKDSTDKYISAVAVVKDSLVLKLNTATYEYMAENPDKPVSRFLYKQAKFLFPKEIRDSLDVMYEKK